MAETDGKLLMKIHPVERRAEKVTALKLILN